MRFLARPFPSRSAILVLCSDTLRSLEPPHPPEMTLIRRQGTNVTFDDQISPSISYAGDWLHPYHDNTTVGVGYYNNSYSCSPTQGDSLTFTFIGTQIADCWLCGVVLMLRWE